ncbi:MAG: hypothetical protein Q7K57_40245 [Burkholderiaceae bacterium]|nr:hypothetical protein [Burkholderiaceae bacterium]
MTEDEKLNNMFSLLSSVQWATAERYRRGIVGLMNECDTTGKFGVVEHVLKKLAYMRSNDLQLGAAKAAQVICQSWGLQPNNTLIAGLAEPSKTCGSSAYVRAIENELDRAWATKIHTVFKSAFRHKEENTNLVLVDDFIGTGNKMKDRITRLKENPKTEDYAIYVVSFGGMCDGIDLITKTSCNAVEIYHKLDKCISVGLSAEVASEYTARMKEMEARIFATPGRYCFGYMQSEAAFYLESFNIPNNNFPILWSETYADSSPRASLFTRR